MLASAKSGYKRIFSTICYTSALSGTFYLSYKYKYNNINLFPSIFTNAQCEKGGAVIDAYLSDLAEDTIDDHFHLRSSIAQVKKTVSANKMLDIFKAMYRNGGEISRDFLAEMFYTAGIEDDRIANHIFDLMDRNCDGKLQPSEIMAVLTMFQGGSATQRFKFCLVCLDLDGGGTVDKSEFRATLTAILEAQYHLGGLSDIFDHDEIFSNVFPNEYHTVAKFKSNRIVRDIFLVADINRDGELSLKEFLHWCRTGSKEVRLLENALLSAVDGI